MAIKDALKRQLDQEMPGLDPGTLRGALHRNLHGFIGGRNRC